MWRAFDLSVQVPFSAQTSVSLKEKSREEDRVFALLNLNCNLVCLLFFLNSYYTLDRFSYGGSRLFLTEEESFLSVEKKNREKCLWQWVVNLEEPGGMSHSLYLYGCLFSLHTCLSMFCSNDDMIQSVCFVSCFFLRFFSSKHTKQTRFSLLFSVPFPSHLVWQQNKVCSWKERDFRQRFKRQNVYRRFRSWSKFSPGSGATASLAASFSHTRPSPTTATNLIRNTDWRAVNEKVKEKERQEEREKERPTQSTLLFLLLVVKKTVKKKRDEWMSRSLCVLSFCLFAPYVLYTRDILYQYYQHQEQVNNNNIIHSSWRTIKVTDTRHLHLCPPGFDPDGDRLHLTGCICNKSIDLLMKYVVCCHTCCRLMDLLSKVIHVYLWCCNQHTYDNNNKRIKRSVVASFSLSFIICFKNLCVCHESNTQVSTSIHS